jgi:hypothetical protein
MSVRMSALRAGRPLPRRKIPGTHFCKRLSGSQGHSAAGRIRSIEESNDLIGKRTRDLPVCSIVPQPTMLPRNIYLEMLWCLLSIIDFRFPVKMTVIEIKRDITPTHLILIIRSYSVSQKMLIMMSEFLLSSHPLTLLLLCTWVPSS